MAVPSGSLKSSKKLRAPKKLLQPHPPPVTTRRHWTQAISCSKSHCGAFAWVSLCWFAVSSACVCVLFPCGVFPCPHRFSRSVLPVNDGDRLFSDANRWPCERRRMANADKKGMAVWPVASGESVRRGRFYRCPKRKVLSFPLRDERVDKMEVSRVCYIPSVLQGKYRQAVSVKAGRCSWGSSSSSRGENKTLSEVRYRSAGIA